MTDDRSKPEDEPADETSNEEAAGAQGHGDEPEERPRRRSRRPYNFVGPVIPPIRFPFDDLFKHQRNLFRMAVPNPAADLVRRMQPRIVPKIPQFRFTAPVVPPVVDLTSLLQKQLLTFTAASWAIPALVIPRAQLNMIRSLQLNVSALLPKVDLTPLIEAFRRNGPPNWHDLDDDVLLGTLIEIAEDGIPTAWVPSAVVLEALVDAAEADRPSVLVNHRAVVLDDCARVCGEVTAVDLQEQVVLLREALEVAENGHLAAAQALGASIFDTTLRHTFKPTKLAGYYKAVKDAIEDRHHTAPFTDMRWGIVHAPAVLVLDMFLPGDPVPAEFNRHASVHAAGAAQYHPANALIALMLATSLLREAHEELSTQGGATP